MMTLGKARPLAERIQAELFEFCEQIVIAGSVRRYRPYVNDLDFVLLLKEGQLGPFRARCLEKARLITDGEMNFIVELAGGIQLDFFIAQPEKRDLFGNIEHPANFGTLLLCRTGSKAHNIWLAMAAQKLDLHWNPYKGVYDRSGHCLASETEEAVFKALGVPFVSPEKREA